MRTPGPAARPARSATLSWPWAARHLMGAGDEGAPAGDSGELQGVAEYWLLATGECGRIALADLDWPKVSKTIDAAIDGLVAGAFPRKRGCDGLCRVLDDR